MSGHCLQVARAASMQAVPEKGSVGFPAVTVGRRLTLSRAHSPSLSQKVLLDLSILSFEGADG